MFEINFQNVGDRAGQPVGGWAKVTVKGAKTGNWQEFQRAKITNSSVRVEANKIAESGTIYVTADYDWNSFEDVLADSFGKAGTSLKKIDYIKHFSGSRQYVAPEKGNLVQLVAKPVTNEVKRKATSGKEAAMAVEAEGKAEAGIISVGIKGTSGETETTGSEREWTVFVLTGGLNVEPYKS